MCSFYVLLEEEAKATYLTPTLQAGSHVCMYMTRYFFSYPLLVHVVLFLPYLFACRRKCYRD